MLNCHYHPLDDAIFRAHHDVQSPIAKFNQIIKADENNEENKIKAISSYLQLQHTYRPSVSGPTLETFLQVGSINIYLDRLAQTFPLERTYQACTRVHRLWRHAVRYPEESCTHPHSRQQPSPLSPCPISWCDNN